ncbi:MAG: polysaccharide deacetylase family protein, partial [Syntrophorhabdus sp.]
MINALTFDLEDWFCVSNLSPFISRNEWDLQEQRAYHNTKRILSLLKRYDTRATFFILGWIAERLPELIRDIDS